MAQHLVDRTKGLHFPTTLIDVIAGIQAKIVEPDGISMVVIRCVHGWIKGMDSTAVILHCLIKRPFVADTYRVHQTSASSRSNSFVQANGFLAVIGTWLLF